MQNRYRRGAYRVYKNDETGHGRLPPWRAGAAVIRRHPEKVRVISICGPGDVEVSKARRLINARQWHEAQMSPHRRGITTYACIPAHLTGCQHSLPIEEPVLV
jgi:hypothetical protein